MTDEMYVVPDEWHLSENLELIIGLLTNNAGVFVSPADFCSHLYPNEPLTVGMSAPHKLRTMMRYARDTLTELTDGKVKIINRKGEGWKITKAGLVTLRKMVEPV